MWDYLFFRLYLEAKVRGRVRLRLRLSVRVRRDRTESASTFPEASRAAGSIASTC